ncbi:MAG: hypothetical protein HOH43_15400 [Candidatus Latescibacteria bacterium]|jgi:hypothetical protein|nr:hypothetical protein [Candidatus Latescibacterota bacterium]
MSDSFQLTDQQLSFFKTFGYLSFPGLMADRTSEIVDEFEAVWSERGGGHNGQHHDGTKRSCIVPFIDQRPYLCSLLDDPRICGIAEALLGPDFNYMGSDGNYYAGDTQWHSDGWHKELRHIKIAFYLDPLTRDSGALRVIPGSHIREDRYANELEAHRSESEVAWGVSGDQIPAVALETNPGDLVCFQHNLKHAAFGGGENRRMFTINLCERYPEDRIAELEKYLEGFARFWVERPYGSVMIDTAGNGRMRHLAQVMAHDGHVAALSEKMKMEMSEPSRG